MQEGVITKLFREKEYGSIRTLQGQDVHFHKYCLWGVQFEELFDGQKVSFEMQETYNGYLGFEIRPSVERAGLTERVG